MMMPEKLVLLLVVCVISEVEMSQEVMKTMSINFHKPLEVCKKEMDIPDSVDKEFSNFWREDYQLSDRNLGCAMMCMASKLDLFDEEYNLHHGNAMEFAMKHGADEALAKQLVNLVHSCGENTPSKGDACETTLAVAQCFKNEIHKLNWAPDMDIIMAEILAESPSG